MIDRKRLRAAEATLNEHRDNSDTEPPATMSVVIVAAGQSSRMGGVDKLALEVNGRPVLWHSLDLFAKCDVVDRVVIVTQADKISNVEQTVVESGFPKPFKVIAGGGRRQDSVRHGIDALHDWGGGAEYIAVHDAARPFVTDAMLNRGLATATKVGTAIPVVPLKDTVKRVEHGIIVDTPDRNTLYAVQTPQIFRADVLRAAHATVTDDVTDDASMVEVAGGLVAVFEGDDRNIKITTPSDIPIANAIASGNADGEIERANVRYGIGFDGHALVDGGPLRLGGEEIEFGMSLKGHSDGDVLMHVVASAILGAAGLGDLGGRFPSSDPRFAGADSAKFVGEAAKLAANDGWQIEHIDATVIAQRPRLAAHVPAFRANIASAMSAEIERVNVKVTSTDEVGAIGEGRGIAAQAIATLIR